MSLLVREIGPCNDCPVNPSHIITSLGLLSDLIGGTLVAVEAVRLENLVRLHQVVLPAMRLTFESPLLWFEGATYEDALINAKRGFGHRRGLFTAFHFLSALGFVAALELVRLRVGLGPQQWFGTLLWHWGSGWRWPTLVACLLGAIAVLPYSVGCWVHRGIGNAIDLFVRALIRVERGTPSGATGILGLVLLLSGFSLQLVGVWV
jgi:hypothetical protein